MNIGILVCTCIWAVLSALAWALTAVFRWGWLCGLLLTIALLLLAIAGWFLHRFRQRRRQGGDPEVEALDLAWAKGLVGLGGAASELRHRPLIVVLGSPASGKSTLLARSGMAWVHGAPAAGREPESTTNIHWWRSDEACVLDTAGAWCQARRTPPAWTRLLTHLRRLRGSAGVQAVVACVPLGDLLKKGPLGWSLEAQTLRDRIEELTAALGTSAPLYLVLTKADHLGGFKDFFSHLNSVDRERVLGVTFPWPTPADPGPLWQTEHVRLVAAMRDLRLHALLAARAEDGARKLVQFPVQLTALGPILGEFLGHLAKPGLREHAALRGIYFTSCQRTPQAPPRTDRQQPSPLEGTGSIFLGAARPVEADTPPDAGLFVRDLLLRVVLADTALARPTRSVQRRRRHRRALCLIVSPVAAAACCVWLAAATARSADNLRDLRTAVAETLAVERGQPEDLPRNLDVIDRLGDRLGGVVAAGNAAVAPAVEAAGGLYARRLGNLGLDRLTMALAADLTRLRGEGGSPDGLYDAFRAYQMLAGVVPVENEPLERFLLAGRRWFAGMEQGGKLDWPTEVVARRILERHVRDLLPRGVGRITSDRGLVDAVARDLGEALWIRQGFEEVMRGLKGQYPAVRGEALLSSEGRETLMVGHAFDGVLTRKAWEDAVEPAIIEKAEALERTLAGLRLTRSRAELRRRLSERFAEEHRRNWLKLIASLETAPISDPAMVPDAIERIAGRASPWPTFVRAALAELDLQGGGLHLGFGDDTAWVAPCQEAIAGLKGDVAAFLAACPSGRRADAEKLLALAKRFSAVSVACGERLAGVQPADKRESLHRGLDGIIHGLWSPIDRAAVSEFQGQWRAQVVPAFRKDLAGRFPFAAAATNEVPLADFARVLNPVDGTLWKSMAVIERLREADVVGHPAITLSESYLGLAARAAAVREACFAGGGSQVQAPFTLTLVQRGGVRDLTFALGPQVHRLYDRPDARYACTLRQGDAVGAKVAIHVVTGEWKTLEFTSQEWAVLRLLRAGDPKPRPGGGWNLLWPFTGQASGKESTWLAAAVLEGDAFGRLVSGDLLSGFDVPEDLVPKAVPDHG